MSLNLHISNVSIFGDGRSIGVTSHKWLPTGPVFLHEPDEQMRVCDRGRGKLVATFTQRACAEILALPLNHLDSQDSLIWTENRAQKLSVKTAYRVALKLKSTGLAEHSSVQAHGITWGKIWKLNVPPKV